MNTKRTSCRILIAGLLLASLLLRFAGLTEGLHLHPDEIVISSWMAGMCNRAQIHHTYSMNTERAYAGGFFVLTTFARNIYEHSTGAIAKRWRYFTKDTSDQNIQWSDGNVRFGRSCNAWMGILAVLFAVLAIWLMTGSRVAALLVGVLMAFDPYSIEHAHYLETDISMLMMLVLSFLSIAWFLKRRLLAIWLPACFVTGFAIGTKFPLGILLVPLLASLRPPDFCEGRSTGAKAAWLLAMALGGALFVAWGFVTACPDAMKWRTYSAALRAGAGAVYAETAGCIGEALHEPFIREKMNLANLRGFSGSLSFVWLALSTAGIVLALAVRRYRRYWPVLLLFPVLYFLYIVFKAPWSRSQEFLPFVPALAFLASLPVACLWSRVHRRSRWLPVLLAIVLIAPTIWKGTEMASLFYWEDTRRLVSRNLSTSYPPDEPLACEQYSNYANDGVSATTVHIGKYYKTDTTDPSLAPFPSYLMMNTTHLGRGLVHPVTHKLYPAFAKRKDELETDGLLLGRWGRLDSQAPRPTFRSPTMELWWLPESLSSLGKPPVELGVSIPRPSVVEDVLHSSRGRDTIFMGAPVIGAREAFLVDKWPRRIAIGGPGDLIGKPVYFVFTTHEHGAEILLKGLGGKVRLTIPPYSAKVAVLRRPWWKARPSGYESISFKAFPTSPFVTYLPCFLHVAFSPQETAQILLDTNHARLAGEWIGREDTPGARSPFWRAIALDKSALPEAKALLARWEKLVSAPSVAPYSIQADGIPIEIWEDFSRIRMVSLGTSQDIARGDHRLANVLPIPDTDHEIALTRLPSRTKDDPAPDVLLLDGKAPMKAFPIPADESGIRKMSLRSGPYTFRQFNVIASNTPSWPLERAELSWRWQDAFKLRMRQLERAIETMERPDAPRQYTLGDVLEIRSIRKQGTALRITLFPLQDHVPPLAFQWKKRRHGRWKKQLVPVPIPPPADATAPFQLTLELPRDHEEGTWGLSVESYTRYNTSILPVVDGRGHGHDVLRLNDLP